MNLGIALSKTMKTARRAIPNSVSKKSKSDLKEVGFMKIYPALVAVALLVLAAPFALAANGDGQVLSYKPNVASTGAPVTLQIQLYNDGTLCLDEIIITPPDTWDGKAYVSLYDRSAFSDTREETNNDKDLVTDDQSSRIVPTHALCPGETVNIEIKGLTAPASSEVSEIVIKTSDQVHNPGSSEVYKTIDTLIPGKTFALPKVWVTKGTKLELEYFHIESFSSSGFTARAWGAWARLDKLYVQATVADPSVQIVMETGGTDSMIYNGPIAAGLNTLTMDYSAWNPVVNTADLEYGYLRDGAGARTFYINGYPSGSLTLLGSTDAIKDDKDYTSSGLGPLGAQGTIITAGGSEKRIVLVNLVDDKGYDINEQIPITGKTDLGSLEVAPYETDTTGNAYFTLAPGCTYGIADVEISTDPLKTTPSVTEYVGIDSSVPASFSVVEGDGAEVPAGGSQKIKVNVYDSCGNLVSNTHQQKVEFDYQNVNCGDPNKLAQTPGGVSHVHEEEFTDMGVAEVYLKTNCQLCLHEVKVAASGLPGSPKTIHLQGVNGKPYKMQLTINEQEITADQCINALIEVVDACGNLVSQIPSEVGDEMEQWESIVRVTIKDPLKVDQSGWASSSQTYIKDSDFREENIYQPWVQGKLNRGVGHVDICGCQGLGVFDVIVESDTLIPGNDSVSVINAAPDCIETETIDQLLQCEKSAELKVAIKDKCGNYWRNQGCGSGEANYCVDLGLEGTCDEDAAHLSTSTVCVPVGFGDPGYLINPVVLYRDTEACCALDITAKKGNGCCYDFPQLEQCDPTQVLFHGGPDHMTTEFFKTRKICGIGCPPGALCIEETQGGMKVQCYEQLHEAIPNKGTETVSEEVLDLFTVYDKCGHIVKDYNGEIDVEVKGEDCASIYQVDHPLEVTGGWCQGTAKCGTLTPFGQEICQDAKNCAWNSATNEGQCSGTPNCSKIMDQTTCSNWDCDWDPTASKCKGLSEYHCEDPAAPPGKLEQITCTKLECTWTPTYSCKGDAKTNNCNVFNKDQCLMVGDGCSWIDNCNQQFPEGNNVIKKLVIHNCKPETEKQWLPLEKDDLIVDKLAFQMTYEQDPALWLYVYLESEKTPGFQPSEDMMVGKAPAIFGGPTIIELIDSPTPYWDDQRQGGVLIRAGDSKDFYIALVKEKTGPLTIPCGTYGLKFLYYQDYNSPDLTNSGSGYPDKNKDGIVDMVPPSGVVEDGCIDSDNFQWLQPGSQAPHPVCPFSGPGLQLRKDSRNDDYGHTTPDYGFGDRYLYNLKFSEGQAWLKFRDLVAEDVDVKVLDIRESGEVCIYEENISATPNPEEITFKEQPATQIKLLNHDEGSKIASCQDEWDPDTNAYHFNIQTTDGFDNPHGKEIEISLDYCLKMPFGDWMIEKVMFGYCMTHGEEDLCDDLWFNKDRCFTRDDLKKLIEASEYAHGFNNLLFGDFFGKEFADWMDQYFMEAKVEFWDYTTGQPLPYHGGKQVVKTDANGQAQIYVTGQKTGVYKIIARPLALDGATAVVSFNADIPEKLDLMAVPAFGVPADGEQEAMLFLRALDSCGNIVNQPICDTTVKVTQGDQVYISQDFECKNNYDGDVTGKLYPMGFLGETCLAVLSDLPQVATLEASAYGLESDTTQISFQGAPVKLAITEISPSDRLPADGQTGAWMTIQVQDIHGNRVTGYLGNGFSSDPGDPWGMTDYRFEHICIDLDDAEASIAPWFLDVDKTTYGWVNFHKMGPSVYCGDLMFGQGKIYITYGNPDCNHGGTVNVKVWDEVPYQGQEFDENGIPVSVEATQLNPAYGHVDFVDPASQWNLMTDKTIALADGKSTVRIEVQVENPFMDVRQAVDGVVYIGGPAADGSVLTWSGMTDKLNPTSARFVTDPTTGKTYLELTSTKPGKAEITVTGGDAYVCMGLDAVTLQGCLEICRDLELCLSGQIGLYNCPTCTEYIPKFWCGYNSKEDLAPKTIEVEFLEVATKDICLDKGWNFISVPYKLDSSKDALNEIFNMSNIPNAYKYDAAIQNFVALSPGSILEPMNGYWLKAYAPECKTLVFATPTMPSIPTMDIKAGWNAVGLAWDSPISMRNALMSINNIYSNVIGWLSGLQKYGIPVANTGGSGPFETGGVDMEPKQGYWVWSTGSGKLAGLAA
jgi:hypothetical protein